MNSPSIEQFTLAIHMSRLEYRSTTSNLDNINHKVYLDLKADKLLLNRITVTSLRVVNGNNSFRKKPQRDEAPNVTCELS